MAARVSVPVTADGHGELLCLPVAVDRGATRTSATNLFVALYGVDGVCEYVSPSCITFTGFQADELIRRDALALVHPEDKDRVGSEIRNHVATGDSSVVTYRARRKDGMWRWFETLCTPFTDADGTVTKYLASTHDVTPRKLVEQRLVETQQRFRSLFDYSLDPVVCLDLQGRIESVNAAFEKLLGESNEELFTQLFQPFVAPADRAMAETIFEMTTQGEPLTFEVNMICRDGRELAASGLSVPVVIAAKVVGVYFILRDCTAQNRNEALVREESEVLALIATGVPLEEILIEIARTVDALCEGATSTVMLLDYELPLLRCVAGDAFPAELSAELDALPLDSGLAACGRAIFRNERISTDIGADPAWTRFRETAQKFGFQTCWSAPIDSARHSSLGTLDVYFKKARPVRPEDIQVIGRAVHLARIAIERERSEQALKESEGRFRQLIENGSDIITIVDAQGAIRYASPSTARLLGHNMTDIGITGLFELVHPDDIGDVRAAFVEIVARPEEQVSTAFRLRHQDGRWRYVEAIASNMLDVAGIRGIVINSRDITARKQAEEQLDYLAYHDALTELPNRLLYNNRLYRAIEQARRDDKMVGVLFLDLDRFKIINDTLGHALGDVLLRSVAGRLAKVIRPCDTVSRWGGDEFTFILPNLSRTMEAIRAADRVVNALSEPFSIQGQELYITGTVGISLFPGAGEDVVALVRNADAAMYRAKERGTNYYQVYTPNMNESTGERLTLETCLRKAVERDEFLLQYQPQVEASSGRIIGAEALVRWKHPELGLIPPDNFIPLAEETGLILQIGEWVMRTACEQAKRWHDEGYGAIQVSVNLSGKQLRDRGLVSKVRSILKETGVDPAMLEIELTESILLDGKKQSIKALTQLRELGVKLAIDDFGTGYSSFLYLRNYQVDTLKIDRSFVRNLAPDTSDAAIAQSVISMAKSLKLRSVAEGVETREQYEILTRQGCDVIQGYYFSAPLSAAALSHALEKPGLRTAPKLQRAA